MDKGREPSTESQARTRGTLLSELHGATFLGVLPIARVFDSGTETSTPALFCFDESFRCLLSLLTPKGQLTLGKGRHPPLNLSLGLCCQEGLVLAKSATAVFLAKGGGAGVK